MIEKMSGEIPQDGLWGMIDRHQRKISELVDAVNALQIDKNSPIRFPTAHESDMECAKQFNMHNAKVTDAMFEKAQEKEKTTGLTFEEALQWIRCGYSVSRKSVDQNSFRVQKDISCSVHVEALLANDWMVVDND